MPTEAAAPGRAAPWLALVLAAAPCTAAFWTPWPLALALLVPALALYLTAAAAALGHAPEPGLVRTLWRRTPLVALAVASSLALIGMLAAWPWLLLQREASLGAVLLFSLALALAWLGLWRSWPLLGLALTDKPRQRGNLALPRHVWKESRRLVAADPSSARGLLAALVSLLLLAGSVAVVWFAAGWPWLWTLTAALVWALLLAPFLAFVLLALIEPARLSAAQAEPAAPAPEPAPVVRVVPAVPTLLPGDPSARLLAAARLGRIDDALAALEAGADPQQLPGPDDRDQRTLAMLAAILPDTRLLRRLIAAGVDVNRRHAGLTALLAATRDSLRGRPDAVMTLLANGADPRATDGEGRSPLHFAALVAEPDVAALLLDAGAPIDALNRDGYSPLGVACAAGNWRLARFLLERKAKVEPAGGQPALLAAAAGEDDPAGVQLLLRFKARPDAPGRLGRTALLGAALAGNAQIVEALLEAGADPDLADEHGVTPLLEAARAGANAVLRLLPAGRLRVGALDHSGRNALVLACQSPRSDAQTIEILLALGVDPEQAAGDGRRARDCALAQARWPLLRVLAPDLPLPTAHAQAVADPGQLQAAIADDSRPWPVRLDEALHEHDLARVRAVLAGARPDPAELFELACLRAGELGEDALQAMADALDRDWLEGPAQPLRRALAVGEARLLRVLRRRGVSAGGLALADWLLCSQGRAPVADNEWVALELLVVGADGFAARAGQTPLQLAVRLGMHRLARALLLRGADPNAADAQGNTPLHRASALGDEHAVALLLRFGARIDARNSECCSACGLALRHGRGELRDWLDWQGWKLPGRKLRDADLIAAAALGDVAALERLLALGLAIDARDVQGATALIRAAGGGHLAAVRLLVERGAALAAAANSGATALSAAISMRQRAVVETLLDAGAEVDQSLPGGVTPLMVAAALGLPEMLVMLLDRGADPARSDQAGNLALHALAQFGFSARDRERATACWRALLGAGAGLADAAGADGLSPLLLLLGARAEPGHPVDEDCLRAQLDLLLAQSPDLDRRDARGFGPLHLCALHGQLAALRRLLAVGADREARDALGRRAQEIAVMRGFVDLAAELEPLAKPAATPSMAQFLRGPGD